ncbi:PTS fructose transporter subunit IIB [Halosolutus amylolyticus]|uniref:PTS fructose transporter subunit IIB n=1 Tax=Halosolutus amylolyticus TaxID=2932267 RepID=A0ABD5PTQ2_9EURY|nr:PTS fructose transporter subunit IIB [Halosolutus amylolyticus]
MKFVAVTSCPTGIAHCQMAAENLEQVAAANDHAIDVEVQGAMGQENELSSEAIAAADAVIVATDTSITRDRFEGKPLVEGSVKDAIADAEGLLERAIAEADSHATAATDDAESTEATDDSDSDTASDGRPAADPVGLSATSRRGEDRSSGLFARLKRLFS